MSSLKLLSPAKLNLFLKVTGRRRDGYHELVTIFHRISLADTLTLRKQKTGFQLTCSRPGLSCGDDNLITRAYRELQREVPLLGGVSVRLKKKIPLGGGLGGGSGNAGAFLLGMNRLYRLKIPVKKLAAIGARLGADVAFFVQNATQAVGTGVGEKLKHIPTQTRHYFVLALSEQGLNTRAVYQTFANAKGARHRCLAPFGGEGEGELTTVKRVARLLLSSLAKKDYGKAGTLAVNDLEAPAFKLRPEIKKTIERMTRSGLKAVRMSGSGPTVFGLAESEKQARQIARRLARQDSSRRYVVCRSF